MRHVKTIVLIGLCVSAFAIIFSKLQGNELIGQSLPYCFTDGIRWNQPVCNPNNDDHCNSDCWCQDGYAAVDGLSGNPSHGLESYVCYPSCEPDDYKNGAEGELCGKIEEMCHVFSGTVRNLEEGKGLLVNLPSEFPPVECPPPAYNAPYSLVCIDDSGNSVITNDPMNNNQPTATTTGTCEYWGGCCTCVGPGEGQVEMMKRSECSSNFMQKSPGATILEYTSECGAGCIVMSECGNSVVEDFEECDDGNTQSGDGCSDICKTEVVCGDGIVAGNEECDEGESNVDSTIANKDFMSITPEDIPELTKSHCLDTCRIAACSDEKDNDTDGDVDCSDTGCGDGKYGGGNCIPGYNKEVCPYCEAQENEVPDPELAMSNNTLMASLIAQADDGPQLDCITDQNDPNYDPDCCEAYREDGPHCAKGKWCNVECIARESHSFDPDTCTNWEGQCEECDPGSKFCNTCNDDNDCELGYRCAYAGVFNEDAPEKTRKRCKELVNCGEACRSTQDCIDADSGTRCISTQGVIGSGHCCGGLSCGPCGRTGFSNNGSVNSCQPTQPPGDIGGGNNGGGGGDNGDTSTGPGPSPGPSAGPGPGPSPGPSAGPGPGPSPGPSAGPGPGPTSSVASSAVSSVIFSSSQASSAISSSQTSFSLHSSIRSHSSTSSADLCGNNVIDPGEECDNGSVCSQDEYQPCSSDAQCNLCMYVGITDVLRCGGTDSGDICSSHAECADGENTCDYDILIDLTCTPDCKRVNSSSVSSVITVTSSVSSQQISASSFESSLLAFSSDSSDIFVSSSVGSQDSNNSSATAFSSAVSAFSSEISLGASSSAQSSQLLQSSSSSQPIIVAFSSAGVLSSQSDSFGRPASCGNRIIERLEQCDDGNRISGDGCSVTCAIENNSAGDTFPRSKSCGNRLLERLEQCDDGNRISGDGCSADCAFEETVLAVNTTEEFNDTFGQPGVCGNGVLDRHEECDDANARSGDGCSDICRLEITLVAAASACGNGILESPEECDDSNKRDGDGCSATCLLEIGICGDGIVQTLLGEQCEPSLHDPSLPYGCQDCLFISMSCGDGVVDSGEECDLGERNSTSADAECRPDCRRSRCGDAILDSAEQCDDGNRQGGDGCSRFCTAEEDFPTMVAGDITVEFPESPLPQPQQQFQFPEYPSYQQIPYQLPLAQLQPLIQGQGPVGDTGPAAVAVVASGMAAGIGWMRRKKK